MLTALLAVAAVVAWGLPAARAGAPAVAPAPSIGGRWDTIASGNDVLSLLYENGILWAGTRAGGLVRWDTASGAYRQYLRPQTPIGSNTVHDIARGPDGRLWLASEGGLTAFYDGGNDDPADDEWFTYTSENSYGLPSNEIRAVAVDGQRVWVGGVQHQDVAGGGWSGGGLGRLDTAGTRAIDDDTWTPVATFESTYREEPDGTSEPGLVSDTINDIALTPQGNLWVATSEHWRIDQGADPSAPPSWQRGHGGLTFVQTGGTPQTADDRYTGFSCDLLELVVTCNVRRVAVDPRGRGWAADGGRGLIQFDASRGQLVSSPDLHLAPPPGDGSPFVQDFAFGPADDPAMKNLVFLATRDGGLAVLDHGGTLANASDDEWNLGRGSAFTTTDGLARNRVQAVTFGGGRAWLGYGPVRGTAGGAQAFDLAEESAGPALVTSGPPSNFVTDIAFGEVGTRWEGHVLVGTGSRHGVAGARLFGAGLVDLDTGGTAELADDSWTTHTAASTDPDHAPPYAGLAGDNIHVVMVQGDKIWVGSAETTWDNAAGRYRDGGLSVFDGTRWTARRVDNTGGADRGLGGGGVSSLAAGCAGEVWAGTGNRWDHLGTGIYALTPGADVHAIAGDRWARHKFPQLASANTLALASDCARQRIWAASTHHVNTPDTGSPIGQWAAGGVSELNTTAGTWSKHTGTTGLESYASGAITGEAVAVAVDPDGTVLAGTYGVKTMDAGALVATKPYWPAVLNVRTGSTWTNHRFERSGMVSSIDRDGEGRLWVATSRGGAARAEAVNPEHWPWDVGLGGLMVRIGTEWFTYDADRDGLPSNDIGVVRVAPDGTIWIGTEGWGLARFDPRAVAPTPTATVNLPTRTPSPTTDPSQPTATRRPTTAVPTVPPPRPSPTIVGPSPTAGPSPTRTPATGPGRIYLTRVSKHR